MFESRSHFFCTEDNEICCHIFWKIPPQTLFRYIRLTLSLCFKIQKIQLLRRDNSVSRLHQEIKKYSNRLYSSRKKVSLTYNKLSSSIIEPLSCSLSIPWKAVFPTQRFTHYVIHQKFSHKSYFAPDRSKLKLVDSRSLVLVLVGRTIYIYFNLTQLSDLCGFTPAAVLELLMNTALPCHPALYLSVTFQTCYFYIRTSSPVIMVYGFLSAWKIQYHSKGGQSGHSVQWRST